MRTSLRWRLRSDKRDNVTSKNCVFEYLPTITLYVVGTPNGI